MPGAGRTGGLTPQSAARAPSRSRGSYREPMQCRPDEALSRLCPMQRHRRSSLCTGLQQGSRHLTGRGSPSLLRAVSSWGPRPSLRAARDFYLTLLTTWKWLNVSQNIFPHEKVGTAPSAGSSDASLRVCLCVSVYVCELACRNVSICVSVSGCTRA